MGALDQLRAANGENGLIGRARSNPRVVVAIAAGAVLLLAWIGWAIYVTSDHGATAGLGVVIAWPAMLAALALISLPFIGGYLLIRRRSDGEGSTSTAEAKADEGEDENEEDSAEEPEDSAEAEEEGEDSDEDDSDEESDDDPESDDEAKAAES